MTSFQDDDKQRQAEVKVRADTLRLIYMDLLDDEIQLAEQLQSFAKVLLELIEEAKREELPLPTYDKMKALFTQYSSGEAITLHRENKMEITQAMADASDEEVVRKYEIGKVEFKRVVGDSRKHVKATLDKQNEFSEAIIEMASHLTAQTPNETTARKMAIFGQKWSDAFSIPEQMAAKSEEINAALTTLLQTARQKG